MSAQTCPQCKNAGFIRHGGFDHSGQVEWNQPCPRGCRVPKPEVGPRLAFIGTAVMTLLAAGVIGLGVLAGLK